MGVGHRGGGKGGVGGRGGVRTRMWLHFELAKRGGAALLCMAMLLLLCVWFCFGWQLMLRAL